ncbi:baseplate J/gp47 family protein [Acetobacter senegalensis]|uniref:baseplate J/gp47 family protein n=1 Tax=Acetobacter senegalensis TaxID=446692 RepID=UPI00264CBF1E|nr:baseplate J/gp47 family protein [Acetobacter senegalensis]MDN7351754.1 baseplate J/gp47 family protein [Acetobacter senegalensis]
MSWQIPTTRTLAQRLAASMLAQQFVAADGTVVRLDPNAPHTLEQVLGVVWALALSEVYSAIRDQLLEMMVTTATADGLLPQHAEMWGVPRNPATGAIGNVLTSVSNTVTLPIGTAVVSDGSVQWLVTTATTIPAGATASVPVQATATGTIGNLAAGTELTLVSPVAGVTSVVVDAQGLAGGAAIESVESWRARIISKIRNASGGGTLSDYQQWALDAGAAYVNVVPELFGLGSVGVVVAMAGPAVPTASQVAQIQSYIDARRPVTAQVTVIAAQLITRSPVISLNPDSQRAREQITAELTVYYPSKGIGGKLYVQEIAAVLTTINGTSNDLIAPTADEQLGSTQIAVAGAISWQSAS